MEGGSPDKPRSGKASGKGEKKRKGTFRTAGNRVGGSIRLGKRKGGGSPQPKAPRIGKVELKVEKKPIKRGG